MKSIPIRDSYQALDYREGRRRIRRQCSCWGGARKRKSSMSNSHSRSSSNVKANKANKANISCTVCAVTMVNTSPILLLGRHKHVALEHSYSLAGVSNVIKCDDKAKQSNGDVRDINHRQGIESDISNIVLNPQYIPSPVSTST
ncbi:hypothetical protein VNO77_17984 [Canavalia gladiata]|uniref:Uncharacterized protein n=1 Tax=Canavalia gladiata TaxID=3824 RepID=A0AAN9QJ81_CANGL